MPPEPSTPNPNVATPTNTTIGTTDSNQVGNTPEANQGNRVPGDGSGMGGTSTGPIDKDNPTDEQLTGGAGDNLEDTVQQERTGTSEGSSEEEPRNRMMAENQVDLDALSESGPEATGNRYGFSSTAAANFARDNRQRANRLIQEAMDATKEADRWMDIADEARGAEERTEEERKRAEEEKRRSEQKMDDLLSQLQRLADRMDEGNS
jgi:hypothetical protein